MRNSLAEMSRRLTQDLVQGTADRLAAGAAGGTGGCGGSVFGQRLGEAQWREEERRNERPVP